MFELAGGFSTRCDDWVQIDTGLDSQSTEHVNQIFGRYITSGDRCEGTSAQTAEGGFEDLDS